MYGGDKMEMMHREPKSETKECTTVLVCPDCKGELDVGLHEVCCPKCGAVYPVVNKVINLLPGVPSKQRFVAWSMEWNWMVRLYETRWWRRGPINNIIIGTTFEKEYDIIVQAMNLSGDETILDLACGPGMYARPLAQTLHAGTVVGLDISMPMLNYTSSQAQNEGIFNLLLIRGSATDLPFPQNQFKVVNCCGALHLFPELSVVQGVFRVLKPGGCFTIAAARQSGKRALAKKYYDFCFRHGWAKAFLREDLESLLGSAGFTDLTFHYEKRYWFIVSAVKPE